jgi:hydroxypyruvate isomerase
MNPLSSRHSHRSAHPIGRRQFLRGGASLAAAACVPAAALSLGAAEPTGPAATRGRVRQSIVQWCFETAGGKWNVEQTCQVAKQLGCLSVELISPEHFPTLKKYGLTCAIGQINLDPDPPFTKGFNHPVHWPRVMKATRDTIDAAAAFGTPNVICFTGFSAVDPSNPNSERVSPEQGAQNCVEGFKQVVRYAEQKGVTLCLEMLNSRVTSHPMKGHPGYQGDHTDYCIEIIKRVGSPRLKLLFDVYHVQVMDGDVITRLRDYKEYIGHVHVAGNPGRGELDDKQEINYRAVLTALVETGYTGFVGHEFIPTRDPLQGLREAVTLCDV